MVVGFVVAVGDGVVVPPGVGVDVAWVQADSNMARHKRVITIRNAVVLFMPIISFL